MCYVIDMKMKRFNNTPPSIDGARLAHLFPGIEIKEEFKIEEAQKILRAEVEEMHHAINYHEIGDTSIISVNGEVYIVCKWDSFGVDLTFERETFPVLGLFGAVLTTVNILRGHNGDEDSEDYEQI